MLLGNNLSTSFIKDNPFFSNRSKLLPENPSEALFYENESLITVY